MGLLDYAEESASNPTDYSSMIQMFNRFLLEQFAAEIMPFETSILRGQDNNSGQDPITQLVGLRVRTSTVCTNCGNQSERPEGMRLMDLIYSSKVFHITNPKFPSFEFYRILTPFLLCSKIRSCEKLPTKQAVSLAKGRAQGLVYAQDNAYLESPDASMTQNFLQCL
jgi:Ubiquitin carboxyl-terminal hydrolase